MATTASGGLGDVIVLGGYGELGQACVQELLETTNGQIVIAGPSVQKAERVALSFGERVRGAYANAADPRTISTVLESASLVFGCAKAEPRAALERALEQRIPFVSLSPLWLGHAAAEKIAERAWSAQIQVVLDAGAVPGLAGVVCEFLTRCYPSLREIWIATTGASEPRTIPPESAADRARALLAEVGALRIPHRCAFPGELGVRWVRAATSPELEGFCNSHTVGRVRYHEIDRSPWTHALERLLRIPDSRRFALVAEAYTGPGDTAPDARITLEAADLPKAAAAVAVAIGRAILAGGVPAGLLSPQEALNPGTLLDAVAKREVRVEGRPATQ